MGKGEGVEGVKEAIYYCLPSFALLLHYFPNHMYTLLCVHVHQVSSFENGGGPIFEGGSIFGASEAWL